MLYILKRQMLAFLLTVSMGTSSALAADHELTDTELHAVLGIITSFILSDDAVAYEAVKKTGQTASYELYDDGYYQKGESHYTRDVWTDIVTDHVTGLEWQDDADVANTSKRLPWVTQANYDGGYYSNTLGPTASTYCSELVLGTHSDWRLPTRKELVGLVDYSHTGSADPSIDPIFEQSASSSYWSSTTYAGNASSAWLVYFGSGYQYGVNKSYSRYVRCVRAGQ